MSSADLLAEVVDSLARRIAVLQETGELDVTVSPRSAARVILALLPGYLLQRSWFRDLDPGDFTATAQALFSAPSSHSGARRQPEKS